MDGKSDPADIVARPRRSMWRFRLLSLFVLIAIVALFIRGVQFWSARAHTTAALAKPTAFDFLDTPLDVVIAGLGNHHDLHFRVELPEGERPVTYQSQANLSQVLAAILDQHDCEYLVTLDGSILIRAKSSE